jgi:hypothetical protein
MTHVRIYSLYQHGGWCRQGVPNIRKLSYTCNDSIFLCNSLLGAFISISEICTTPLPILAAMKKAIQHWINGPLST